MNRNALLNIVILLVMASLGVVGYKLSPVFRPGADTTLPVSDCSPGLQACTATLPDGSQLEFAVEPRPIRALRTLRLIAAVSGSAADTVEVDFAGTEMEMGYNRALLAGTNGLFSGQAILPVCIAGTMTWTATVLVTTEKQRIAVPFHFEVSGR